MTGKQRLRSGRAAKGKGEDEVRERTEKKEGRKGRKKEGRKEGGRSLYYACNLTNIENYPKIKSFLKRRKREQERGKE